MQQKLSNQSVVFLGAHGQGKSTIAGLIVKELNYASPYVLERIECHLNVQKNPDLRYAFLMDRIRTEQNLSHTQIFSTYHVNTTCKEYFLINIPGQYQYINQMQIGIAYGDIAVFILSGVKEKYMQSLTLTSSLELQLQLCVALGKQRIICVINDMDIVEYQQACYQFVVNDFSQLLAKYEINPQQIQFIPISLKEAENINTKKQNMNWYQGPTLIEALDKIPIDDQELQASKPLRFVMHDCIRIPGIGTIALGKLLYGTLKKNQILSFAPIPFKSSVKTIENNHFFLEEGTPNQIIGVNLLKLSYKEISNGHICSDVDNDPAQECLSFVAKLKIMEDFKHQLKQKQYYTIHFFTKRMQCSILKIQQNLNVINQNEIIENPQILKAGDIGIIEFKPIKQITLENYVDYPQLGRIAIVDNRRMIAFGIILEVKNKKTFQDIQQKEPNQ
ncbi:unnamed protein product [Paramecium pentaurelia]|uniref:Tr-type G domain-containing protein n=1 Tax=Paramecium pentaurelia TaxID=43138 RepID=A0A8S1WU35_9CILI|nr:unnamed protein product [Paramecium pentaurelia]